MCLGTFAVVTALLLTALCAGPSSAQAESPLSKDSRSVMWEGKAYKPIDEAGVYYYDADSVSGIPMPKPRTSLAAILKRHGFHGVLRCELVDYVDCSRRDHGFIGDARSRVLKLVDGDLYRVTAPAGELSWFSYFLKTKARPGRPHLVVVQTINDVERYTTVSLTHPKEKPWAAPYTGEEKAEIECQEPYPYGPDVGGCIYNGREYPLDGKPVNYMFLYYPKAAEVKVTISYTARAAEFHDENGAAAARIWLFDIVDPIESTAVVPAVPANGKERRIGLYVPHPWFLYSHYGIPARTEEQRREGLRSFIDYMKFCGFNQLQSHVINGSDVANCAWYDSELYDPLQGNLIEELIPLAEEADIEVIPIVTPIMTPYVGGIENIPDRPDEHGFCKMSLQLDRDGKYTNTMGRFAPDPLRPEVQEWLFKCFREILDRCAEYPNVPGVAFRVNGKIGLCYVGFEKDKCGQDTGYSRWDIEQFEKDTGIEVPRMQPTPHGWLRANAWREWIDWRCERMHDFWLRARDLVRSYRPDLKLVVACDLPSEYPGYNIEWVEGTPPRELMRHHGYDPELFKDDEGVIIQRGMMISSERHFDGWGPPHGANAWAHKAFNYADGVVECYETPAGQAVEFYHNYWEEAVHPDPQYGTWLRTATPAPPGQFYFEPASHSIRKANVHTMVFMGWERASLGHEHDLRRFTRAFRALPYTEPRDFDGKVEVLNVAAGAKYRKPENPDVWAKWFGDRLAVVNDTGDRKYVSLTMPSGLAKGRCLFDFGAARVLLSADKKAVSKAEVKLHLLEHDLHTLGILSVEEARKLQAAPTPLPGGPGRLKVSVDREVYGGRDAVVKFTLTNAGKSPITDAEIDLALPKAWNLLPSADGTTPTLPIERRVAKIAPGKSASFAVRVGIPVSDVGVVSWATATAVYHSGGKRFVEQGSVVTSPQPPVVLNITPDRFTDKAAGDSAEFHVELENRLPTPVEALLTFDLPEGWQLLGHHARIQAKAGESASIRFAVVIPDTTKTDRYTLAATAQAGDYTTPRAECRFDLPLIVRKALSPIKADGDLSDWDSAAPSALVIGSEDFRLEDTDDKAPANLSPAARISWDDEYLYIACSIAGGSFRQPHTGEDIHEADSLRIGIDAAADTLSPDDGHYNLGFARTSTAIIEAWRWRAPDGKSTGSLEVGVFAARTDGQRQYYEAAIPWSELTPFQPEPRKILGLALAINYDHGAGHHYLSWYSGVEDGRDTSKFATVSLR